MSTHYTIDFALSLRNDLSKAEKITLFYLIESGEQIKPNTLPLHPYFQNGLPEYTNHVAYKDFPEGPFISKIWVCGKYKNNDLLGLVLRLPSLKLESVYEEFLSFAVWLATLSEDNGFVGSIKGEGSEIEPMHLYIYHQELYMNADEGYQPILKSVSTGKQLIQK